MTLSQSKLLDEAHEDVPPHYYHEAIKKNLLQRFWHTQRIKHIKRILVDISATKILDVGCHAGRLTYEVKQQYPQTKIYGIDMSKNAVTFAKKKYKDISFVVGRAEELPFPTKEFDLVTCFEVLEHIHEPTKVIRETKRVLKRNGNFIILVPSENKLFQTVWYFWTKLGPGRVWHHTHVQKFDNKKLDELLNKNGFEIKKRKLFILRMLLLIHATKK